MINIGTESLEIKKILEKLSKKAVTKESKEKILNLDTKNSFDESFKYLEQTKFALSLMQRFKDVPIGNIENIKDHVKRANIGAVLSLKELLEIKDVLDSCNNLNKYSEKFTDNILDEKFLAITPNNFLFKKIKSCILSESEISDTASEELYEIRKKIRNTTNKAREILEGMIKSSLYRKYLQESIITIRNSRLVLPVKSEYKSEIDGMIHDSSSSGSTLFIEPKSILLLNNEVSSLKLLERKEIEKILKKLSEEVAKVSDSLILSYNNIIAIDIIFSKARLSKEMRAISPKINKDGRVVLKGARHPLINSKKVVPINISLGEDFDLLIITGPNTGGKTVSIKIVGIFSLMIKLGLMIPCDEGSEFCIFERILVDIGDEQSIEQSLSTFSGHILKLTKIIESANEKSLVLIDEIGAGTDPEQGAAIALAIIEILKTKKCKILLTTHYPSLKEYAFLNLRVQNASLEFNEKTLMPTYKLVMGSPGTSNAFEIAKKLGMSEVIINRAKELVSSESKKLDNILKILEKKRKETQIKKYKADELYEEAKQIKEQFSKKEKKINSESEKILENSRKKAKEILEKAKREASAFLLDFKKIKISPLTHENKLKLRRNIKSLDSSKESLQQKKVPKHQAPGVLEVGDRVLITDLNKEAVVSNFAGKEKSVELLMGNSKVFVSISRLKFLEKQQKKAKKISVTRTFDTTSPRNISQEVDLRGMYALEAIEKLDRFIDQAIVAKLSEIRIIHGKGTGVLMKEVSEHLKTHPNIKEQRKGSFGEGGIGVTIAKFR